MRASDFASPDTTDDGRGRSAIVEAEGGAESDAKPVTGLIDATQARNGRADVVVLMGAPGDGHPAAPAAISAATDGAEPGL
ncbi:MAG: hypothetical protein CVV40_00540, partial [Planctomycetes bacterium HGW-Planctomycetes-2]